MQFIKNNLWTLCLIAFVAVFGFAGDAAAQEGGTVMSLARDKAVNVFKSVKTIIFVVGGFGLVGLAFAAIFGKINWKWFASLAVGLAILAAAGSIVNYATGDVSTTDRLDDSFQTSSQYLG